MLPALILASHSDTGITCNRDDEVFFMLGRDVLVRKLCVKTLKVIGLMQTLN